MPDRKHSLKRMEDRNGELTVMKNGGPEGKRGGDILTVDEFGAFELSFEFKLTAGANSGMKYLI